MKLRPPRSGPGKIANRTGDRIGRIAEIAIEIGLFGSVASSRSLPSAPAVGTIGGFAPNVANRSRQGRRLVVAREKSCANLQARALAHGVELEINPANRLEARARGERWEEHQPPLLE